MMISRLLHRRSSLLMFLLASASAASSVACGGETIEDATPPSPPIPASPVCTETVVSAAEVAVDGELVTVTASGGAVYAGALSVRIGEDGAVWRLSFDGTPNQRLSDRYLGGPVVVADGSLLHVEGTRKDSTSPPDGRLAVVDLASGARTVFETPLIRSPRLVRDPAGGAAFLALGEEWRDVWLWTRGAAPRKTGATVNGSLFANETDLFDFALDVASLGDGPRFVVRRFDRARVSLQTIHSFPAGERELVGIDHDALYFVDDATRTIRVVDIASGEETETMGHDIAPRGLFGRAHLDDDAIYVVQGEAKLLARIDKHTGEQREIADASRYTRISDLATDACYLYAATEGGRRVARIPKQAL